jgi:hypothetical protein
MKTHSYKGSWAQTFIAVFFVLFCFNSFKLETIQMSINRWKSKHIVYAHNRILLSGKKRQTTDEDKNTEVNMLYILCIYEILEDVNLICR